MTQAPGATGGGAQTQGSGGGGGSASILDAAKKVEHMCDLMPTDLAAAIVPSAPPAVEEQFPLRCSVYGDVVAIEIVLETHNSLGETPSDAEAISGIGAGAYLQHLSAGNFYLSVALSPEGGVLHAEVNNQDGKDHKDEVVNLARAVLQKLGG